MLISRWIETRNLGYNTTIGKYKEDLTMEVMESDWHLPAPLLVNSNRESSEIGSQSKEKCESY